MRDHRVLPIGITLALAVSAAANPASAQRISSPYQFIERGQDLGPFVGWIATDRGSADFGPKSSLIYGLQYTLRITNPLNLSVFGAYWPAERDVIDPSTESGDLAVVGIEEMEIIAIAGRLQLNLTGSRTWHNLIPYVFGGIGLAVELTGDPGCVLNSTRADCRILPRERFDFGNKVMGQAGVGTAWLPGGRIGFRLSIQDNIWRLETPEGYFDPGVQLDPIPPEDDWTNNFQFTLAATFWF